MSHISVRVHEDQAIWSDLLEAQADRGYKILTDDDTEIEMIVVDGMTESGRPVVAVRQEFDGEIVVMTFTLRTFLQVAKGVMDAYVEDVRLTFGLYNTED